MAKVTFNTVLDGHDNPRVGDEYEVAPGKWGKMRMPTLKLREEAFNLVETEGATDLEFARLVLDGLPSFGEDEAIHGMADKVVTDFFTLLKLTREKLQAESGQSDP